MFRWIKTPSLAHAYFFVLPQQIYHWFSNSKIYILSTFLLQMCVYHSLIDVTYQLQRWSTSSCSSRWHASRNLFQLSVLGHSPDVTITTQHSISKRFVLEQITPIFLHFLTLSWRISWRHRLSIWSYSRLLYLTPHTRLYSLLSYG